MVSRTSCRHHCIEPLSLAAVFMKAFGLSPVAMLKVVRLKKAAELLATASYPVAEAARMVSLLSRRSFSSAVASLRDIDPGACRHRLAFVLERRNVRFTSVHTWRGVELASISLGSVSKQSCRYKMRNNVIVVVGFLCLSPAANAQSSVTLFGALDEGVNFTNNVGGEKEWQTSGVDLVTSRWGIKGTEDLGGGLRGMFDLESGIALDNGNAYYGGRLFGYQSYVGLQSDIVGTLTLGRQFDTVTDTIGLMTANGNWGGYLFSHPVDNDNTDASFHANNSVKYTSPGIAGFTVMGLYGFSNAAGQFEANRMYGVGLKYAYKSFTAAAVYEDLSSPGGNANGSVASDDYGFVASNQKIYGAGIAYGLGAAGIGITYTHVALQQPRSSIYLGDLGTDVTSMRFDNFEANVKYNITPTLFFGAMYTYSRTNVGRAESRSSLHWNQVGLMAQYSLSGRTALYAQTIYQKISGRSNTVFDGAYVPGSAGISSNSHQIVGRLGITHTF
ncbi:porin [Paraburkholderia sp. SIMBA_049]